MSLLGLLSACGGGGSQPTELQSPNSSTLRFNAQGNEASTVQISLDGHNLPPLPKGLRLVSDFHQFSPNQAQLDDAQVRIALDPQALQGATQVRLLSLNAQGAWVELRQAKLSGGVL
jgi:hypothetical protein